MKCFKSTSKIHETQQPAITDIFKYSKICIQTPQDNYLLDVTVKSM